MKELEHIIRLNTTLSVQKALDDDIHDLATSIEQYYEPRLKSYKESVKKLDDEHDEIVIKAKIEELENIFGHGWFHSKEEKE